uniref:BHLH domain-containing protein n=1 Tax=Strigamia maritima TaxID=126957 RepID=T1ILQ2_STRMM
MPAEKRPTKPSPCLSQRLRRHSKSQRTRRHRLLCSREYKRLGAMVPAIATKPKVSKVTVIEETIKYIDELHSALLLRLQTKGLPQALKGLINTQDVQHLSRTQLRDIMQHMMPSRQESSFYPPTPPTPVCQRSRRTASFHRKKVKKTNH